ncbi:MAG: hypothetical protein ACK4ZS_06045, partial [Sulfurimicrobium sp.]
QINGLVDAAYRRFHEQHGFARLSPPPLNLERARQGLLDLAQPTADFCNDPLNIMTEKHFLIRKFYTGLVASADIVFDQARGASESWLNAALAPLMAQVRDYTAQLERRVATVKQIHDNVDTLEDRIKDLVQRQAALLKQNQAIDSIRDKINGE